MLIIRPHKSSTFRSHALEKLETRHMLAGHGFGEFQQPIDLDLAIEDVGGPIKLEPPGVFVVEILHEVDGIFSPSQDSGIEKTQRISSPVNPPQVVVPNWPTAPTPTAQVKITLAATDPQGNPISSVHAGDSFVLQEYVQDVDADHYRADWQLGGGVYAAYNNINFDPSVARVSGGIHYSPGTYLQTGTVSDSGMIEDIGAASTSFLPGGLGKWEILSIPMTATKSGPLTFSTTPDVQRGHDTLLYSKNDSVSTEQIDFGSLALPVAAANPATSSLATPAVANTDLPAEIVSVATDPTHSDAILSSPMLANAAISMSPAPTSPAAASLLLVVKKRL